jgi:hypothetical protein
MSEFCKLQTNYPRVTQYLLDIYETEFGMTSVSPASSQFWIGITVLAGTTSTNLLLYANEYQNVYANY